MCCVREKERERKNWEREISRQEQRRNEINEYQKQNKLI